MIVRVSKIALEVLGAVLAGIAVIAGFIAYRLAYEGPIHLSFLKPYVEEALNQPGADFQFVIQDTVLAWAGWERTVDIRGVGVRIQDSAGRDLASVPELGFGLSGGALLRGLVAPSRIELFRPELTLRRNEDGDFQFGDKLISNAPPEAGADVSASQADLIGALLRELLAAPDPDKRTGYLTEAAIYSGALNIDDRHAGNVWRAENLDLNLARGERGLAGSFRFSVPQFGDPARLSGSVFLPSGGDRFAVDARLQRFAAPSIGLLETGLAALGNAKLFLEGEAQTSISLEGEVGVTEFAMFGSNGEITLPDLMKAPLPVKTLAAKGQVDPDQDLISLDSMEIDLDGPTFVLSGQGNGFLRGRATDDGAPVLTATLKGTGIDWQKADGWWPETAASGARGWLIPNVTSGVVEALDARTKIRFPAGQASAVLEELAGTFKARDLTVHYLRPMPPIEHGAVTATFDATQFAAKIEAGEVGRIKIRQGDLLITGLDQDDQFIKVGGDLASPMRDALALLDHERLGYTSKLGLKPADASGDVATHLQFDFPAKKELTFAMVEIGVTAGMSNVGLKQAMFEQDVTEGNLELALTQNGMRISGPLKFGGIPLDLQWLENFYDDAPFEQQIRAIGTVNAQQRAAFGYETRPFFDGPSLTDLTYISYAGGRGRIDASFDLTQSALAFEFAKWSKAAGVPGRGKLGVEMRNQRIQGIPLFDVAAGDLKAAGRIDFDKDGKPRMVTMPSLKYGRNNLSNVGVAFKGELIEIGIGGGDVDVEPWMENDAPVKDDDILAREENEPQRPFRLLAPSLNAVRVGDGRLLHNVKVELYHDPMWWDVIDVSATLEGGAPLTLSYRPGEPGEHRLTAETTDAGAALRALDIFDSIKGGTLKITGRVKDDEPRRPLRGRLESSSFRLLDTPFFVRFLSVAALTGLVDVLTGEGFYFDGASARFTKTMGTIEVRRFRSAGPSIGLTSSGTIDLDRQKIDLEGVIVPAYALNSILGNIPILGNIIQGGPGEGLFSATYKISGDLPEPKIDVNPWSALAPGFLRDIFTQDIDEGDGTYTPPKIPSGSHK